MNLSADVVDVLAELINVGIGRAASALNQLLEIEVTLTIPRVRAFSLDELTRYLEARDAQPFVSVCQAFEGGLRGRGVVSFPVIGGKTLVNLLLEDANGASAEEGDAGDLLNIIELEAIGEVGNIIINAVQGTISDMGRLMVDYQLPQVRIVDRLPLVLEGNGNTLYIYCEAMFSVQNTVVEGMIILVYAYDNIDLLVGTFLDI